MYPSGSVDDYMFLDADNLTYIDAKGKKPKNGFSRFLKKINLSRKLNAIIHLPFKKKWYDLKGLGEDENTQYYLFILASSFIYVDMHMIKKMFSKENMHLRLILLDPITSNTPVPERTRLALKKIQFEKIYTYDLVESQTYGYKYMNEYLYTDTLVEGIKPTHEYDLYFLGRFKSGRGENVFTLAEKMHEKGVNFRCKMQVTSAGIKDANLTELKDKDIIEYFDDFIIYNDVVKECAKSNCILELIQDTESDTTLRYFEAVVLNKKLLTNNKNIVNMRYYDPKYMKIFTSLDDIDYEWVKKEEHVDYGYKHDFSSKIFFDEEIKLIEKC